MAKKKTVEKERGRVWIIMLYPDNEKHVQVLEQIKKEYDHAYILHDRCVARPEEESVKNGHYTVGEIKKAHWHVVIRLNNPVWNTALGDALGIEVNVNQKSGNINKALEYLIHYNNPEKVRYELDEVKGNLRTKLIERVKQDEKTEGEHILSLIEYISSFDRPISIKEFAVYTAQEGIWSEFRRSSSIFLAIINEHNSQFYTKKDS